MTERLEQPWHPYPNAPDVDAVRTEARENFDGMVLTSAYGGGIDAMPAAGLFRNMLRLVVRACEEYQAALQEIVVAIEAGSPSNMTYASTHWEGCVEALFRGMRIAETFRRNLGKWAPEESHLRIDREARFTDQEMNRVGNMRDAIQHLDEEIGRYTPEDDHHQKGQGLFIYSAEDGIHFHGHEIPYAVLAEHLERLGALCTWLYMQNIPAGHPLAHPERTTAVNIEGAEAFQHRFVWPVQ